MIPGARMGHLHWLKRWGNAGLQWELHPSGVSSKRGPSAYRSFASRACSGCISASLVSRGFSGPEEETIICNLSASLSLGSQLLQREETYTPVIFFLPPPPPFFSFFFLLRTVKGIQFLKQQNLLTVSELGGIFFLAENAYYPLNCDS